MVKNEMLKPPSTYCFQSSAWKAHFGWAAGLAMLIPMMANAHPGHYHPTGEIDEFETLSAGLAHPFGGADHLLMALAAGWLAFARKGAGKWLSGGSFLAFMLFGSILGRAFSGVGLLEVGLALTLIATGGLFFMDKLNPSGVVASIVAAAGLIHGFAHGSEASTAISLAPYMGGIIFATGGLMLLGGSLQRIAATMPQTAAQRLAGAALIAFGTVSLFQAL